MPESPEGSKQVMSAWESWMGKHGAAILDAGNPTTPVAKTVSSDGKVSDGVSGTHISGYTVVKAGSLDEAVEIAKGCPVLQGGAKVAVYETFDAMAMAQARQN
jgi:hypothetical protein